MSEISLSESSPATPTPVRPPLPTEPPPVTTTGAGAPLAASDSPVANSPGPHAQRELTSEQRAEMAELSRLRAALKLQEMKRKDVIEADKLTEEKISAAVNGRTAVAVQGAKDLMQFVQSTLALEDVSTKTLSKVSALFAQETATTRDALEAFLASGKELETMHADLHKVLQTCESKRAGDTLAATEETCKHMKSSCSRMLSDLANARKKLFSAFEVVHPSACLLVVRCDSHKPSTLQPS